jgi:hypothetical protein
LSGSRSALFRLCRDLHLRGSINGFPHCRLLRLGRLLPPCWSICSPRVLPVAATLRQSAPKKTITLLAKEDSGGKGRGTTERGEGILPFMQDEGGPWIIDAVWRAWPAHHLGITIRYGGLRCAARTFLGTARETTDPPSGVLSLRETRPIDGAPFFAVGFSSPSGRTPCTAVAAGIGSHHSESSVGPMPRENAALRPCGVVRGKSDYNRAMRKNESTSRV